MNIYKNFLGFFQSRIIILPTIIICGVVFFANTTFADMNVVTNGGAETGSLSGWNVISNAGNGWSVNFDNLIRSGSYSFMSSYGLDSLSQTIDLYAAGFTSNQLDTLQPTIVANLYTGTRGDQGGQFYVTYKLLAGDGTTVLATSGNTFGNSGALVSINANDPWTARTYSFNGYGSGVRYVYVEFGGQDQSFWAGHYGTHFDDVTVTVAEPATLAPAVAATTTLIDIVPVSLSQNDLDFSINDGATVTNSRNVKLTFNADPSRVVRYAVSLDSKFSNTGQVSLTKDAMFTLPESSGTYTIYVKYFSPTGHSSATLSKTIEYKSGQSTATVSAGSNTNSKAFTRNLSKGSSGDDVKRLQVFLNNKGYLVAQSGSGSIGNETTYFGPSMLLALKKFQSENGVNNPNGVFGPTTRGIVNKILGF